MASSNAEKSPRTLSKVSDADLQMYQNSLQYSPSPSCCHVIEVCGYDSYTEESTTNYKALAMAMTFPDGRDSRLGGHRNPEVYPSAQRKSFVIFFPKLSRYKLLKKELSALGWHFFPMGQCSSGGYDIECGIHRAPNVKEDPDRQFSVFRGIEANKQFFTNEGWLDGKV